ncbi:MAG: TAXI family TRAP transporter solute-binding subunit [Oscillospiraceae bacterium]
MKKLSHILGLLLALTLAFSLTACAPAEPEVAPTPDASADVATSPAADDHATPPASPSVVRISCGPLNGYQNVLYNAVSDLTNKTYPNFYSFAIEASTGSAENARYLANGETDLGTMGMDMTLACYNAEGDFAGLPAKQIGHVATHSGTGATVQVITSAKSSINTIPDLKGVKFGVTAGMMAGYLDDVLFAYDMTTGDLGKLVNLSLSDLCSSLQDGTIDAFLYATPAPSTNFTDLAMTYGIKVIDIGQEAVDKLIEAKPWYHTVKIPAGTYDKVDTEITTFAQYTVLCARLDVPEQTVYDLVKTMMENADALEAVHKNAAGTCAERGIEGAIIPFHPGAERYYREIGVLK